MDTDNSHNDKKEKSMRKFIAFDVGVGDSFYLEIDENIKILFDGGLKENYVVSRFQRETGSNHVDIMVCSHGDADHVKGLIGFLNDPGTTCNQLWIPAGMTSKMEKLVLFPDEFYQDLTEEIYNLEEEYNSFEDMHEYFNKIKNEFSSTQSETEADLRENTVSRYFANLSARLFYEDDRQRLKDQRYQQQLHNHYKSTLFNNQKIRNLSQQAFRVAASIRDLAIAAFNKGVAIRLFEYSEMGLTNGGEAFLRPVNSQEIFTVKKKDVSTLYYLYLSTINKESLVFYSPDEDDGAGVLFCADSNFSFNQKQSSLNFLDSSFLITVPHHGSRHNSDVYEILNEYIDFDSRTLFVRSDDNRYGSDRARPCNDFLDIPKARRICTHCRHPESTQGQTIKLTSFNGKWVPDEKSKLIWCHCVKY